MSRHAFFLGCTAPVRTMNYELSTRKVAEKLGIELVDLPFTCCGYPIEPIDQKSAVMMSMRNLALAESEGLDIVTLCSACAGTLTRFNKILREDKKLRAKSTENLQGQGFEYKGSVKVRHFARMLYEDIGITKLKSFVTRNLNDLKLLTHYGCHYIRPSNIYEYFDYPEAPHTLDELVEITGAKSLNVPQKDMCCGAALLAIDKNITLAMAESKLQMAKEIGADALIVICPFCGISYDMGQIEIEAEFHRKYNLPVLYYPQLLGLAMGLKPNDLGLMLNSVKVQEIFDKAS